MKGYETWFFRDRSIAAAIALSLLWHFFWFFAITIVVSPEKTRVKTHPRIVALGPVIDDSIFRTLVETRVETSQTFYRSLSEFGPAPEPPVTTIERREPGDVVSVPAGRRFLTSLKNLLGAEKTAPEYEFISRVPLGYAEEVLGMEGEAKGRAVLTRPEEPQILIDVASDAQVEVSFAVEPSGAVGDAAVTRSSGNASVDEQWLRYLKRWQFAPSTASASGKIRFHVGRRAAPAHDAPEAAR